MAVLIATSACKAPTTIVPTSAPAHRFGNIYASDLVLAQRVYDTFSPVNRAVLELIPEGRPYTPPDIWVLDTPFVVGDANAGTIFNSLLDGQKHLILLGQASIGELPLVMAHELVHYYLHREPYLPAVVEEGMACVLAWTLFPFNPPDPAPSAVWSWNRALEIPYSEVVRMDNETFASFRAAGVDLVRWWGWRWILDDRENHSSTHVSILTFLGEKEDARLKGGGRAASQEPIQAH